MATMPLHMLLMKNHAGNMLANQCGLRLMERSTATTLNTSE
jgi:hypothetical protein